LIRCWWVNQMSPARWNRLLAAEARSSIDSKRGFSVCVDVGKSRSGPNEVLTKPISGALC